MFGSKAPNLNTNLLFEKKNLKLVIYKILSIVFIVITLLLSHINEATLDHFCMTKFN